MSQNSINVDARILDLFLNPVTIYGDEHIHIFTRVVDLFVPSMNKIQYMTAYQVQYMIIHLYTALAQRINFRDIFNTRLYIFNRRLDYDLLQSNIIQYY